MCECRSCHSYSELVLIFDSWEQAHEISILTTFDEFRYETTGSRFCEKIQLLIIN